MRSSACGSSRSPARCRRRWASRTTTRGRSCSGSGREPARSVLEPVGGQGPQKLVTEFCGAIADGEADVVMIIGSETRFDGALLRRSGRQARLHRACRRPARGPRSPDLPIHQRIHDQARIDRRARPVRVAGQRTSRPAGAECRRLPPDDGGAVRAVLESRCQEPVFVLAGRTFGAGDRNGHRRQPDDLRPVSPASRRPRSGQPGCRRDDDVRGRRASSRCARGEVGVSARPRRHGGAGTAGARRSQRQPRGRACRARGVASGGDRCRRHRHLRPLQLLSIPGVRRLRGTRDPTATTHAGSPSPVDCPTSAVLGTATRCTPSPRRSARCGTSQDDSASSAPTAAP